MNSKTDSVTIAFVVSLIVVFGAGLPALAQPPSPGWQAGVARVDITPEEPLWLAGYAARTRPAEGVLQPLWAKALALKDASGNRAVLVTSDILGFPKAFAEKIRNRIETEYGLNRSQLILSASHTHSAPVIGASLRCIYAFDDAQKDRLIAYTDWLAEQIVALVGEALDALAPAQLHSGNGVARFAVNRRNNVEREITPVTPLKGPVDHAAPCLKVSKEDGTLAAVVFGYACHATVLDGYQYSGDYPGFAQAALEARYPGVSALFFAGCGADQNPLPRRTIPLAQQYGDTLAAAVVRVLEEPMKLLEPILATTCGETDLALEPAPDKESLVAKAGSSTGYEQECTQDLLDQMERDGALPTSYAYPVQVWSVGGQRLVVLGGEVVVSYAVGIKELLGADTFVMTYANDLMAYIPSETVLEEGGYEGKGAQIIYGLPAAWARGLEKQVLAEVQRQEAVIQETMKK